MSARQNDASTASFAQRKYDDAKSVAITATKYVSDHETDDQGRLDIHPKDVRVSLEYLAKDPLYQTVKPRQFVPNFRHGKYQSNVKLEGGPPEMINDVRGREHEFSLDQNGFCYIKAPTLFSDWTSQPKIGQFYLQEIESLLKRHVDGCDEIILYDARIREPAPEGYRVNGLSHNPYALQVHVDQTESSIVTMVHRLTEMKADYLLRGRVRIVNIWRPIKHPVYDCALALADGGNLTNEDVIECDRHRLDTGNFWDTMGVVQYRKGYDWYYMSEQDEEDVVLFKNYDSDKRVAAPHCLHTAFNVPERMIVPGTPTRESIEVRALVFTHPKENGPLSEASRIHRAAPTPQPLAESLQRSELKSIEVSDGITYISHQDLERAVSDRDSIIFNLRQDLDDIKEEKEAMTVHRDEVCKQLDHVRAQNGILHQNVCALNSELSASRSREQNRLKDESDGLAEARNVYGPDAEMILLRQRIEKQQAEIQALKAEALYKGSNTVSKCWQASVDEAIRREREKDSFVIDDLRHQIQQLQTAVQQ